MDAGGPLSNPVRVDCPGHGVVNSIFKKRQGVKRAPARLIIGGRVIYAEAYAAALMRIDSKISVGLPPEPSDDLRAFYAACHSIFEKCSGPFVSAALEAVSGVRWGEFVGALAALGWHLLPDDRRRDFPADRIITPSEIFA